MLTLFFKSVSTLADISFNIDSTRGRHTSMPGIPFHTTNYDKNYPLIQILLTSNDLQIKHNVEIFNTSNNQD